MFCRPYRSTKGSILVIPIKGQPSTDVPTAEEGKLWERWGNFYVATGEIDLCFHPPTTSSICHPSRNVRNVVGW